MRFLLILALFLAGCAVETNGEQEVSGTVEVRHVITIELPEVFQDECEASTETPEEYAECIRDYTQNIIGLIQNLNPDSEM